MITQIMDTYILLLPIPTHVNITITMTMYSSWHLKLSLLCFRPKQLCMNSDEPSSHCPTIFHSSSAAQPYRQLKKMGSRCSALQISMHLVHCIPDTNEACCFTLTFSHRIHAVHFKVMISPMLQQLLCVLPDSPNHAEPEQGHPSETGHYILTTTTPQLFLFIIP